MDNATTKPTPAENLRLIAAAIRANPYARATIAEGFELIADAMEPCEDCGHPAHDDFGPTIDPKDYPSVGV